jgi:hypothetical protein
MPTSVDVKDRSVRRKVRRTKRRAAKVAPVRPRNPQRGSMDYARSHPATKPNRVAIRARRKQAPKRITRQGKVVKKAPPASPALRRRLILMHRPSGLGGQVDDNFRRELDKAHARVYQAAIKAPPKVRDHVLRQLYAGEVKSFKERQFENAPDDVRKAYGLKPHKPDTKVAGINVDEITGKIGRQTKGGALTALDYSSRPLHQTAGEVRALIKGESVSEAGHKGLHGQEHYTFSDVLDAAGVKNKYAKGIGGFALDVAADPTTYVSFGTASVAKQAGAKAAGKALTRRVAEREAGKLAAPALKTTRAGLKAEQKTYRKALAKGRPKTEAQQLASQARQSVDQARQVRRTKVLDTRAATRAKRKAEARAPEGKGVTVGVGKFRTSGRLTNSLTQPARLARREPGRVRVAGREMAATFSPHIKPHGVTQAEFDALKGAERESRSAVVRGRERAVSRAQALASEIPKEQYGDVIEAVERGTVYTLPKHLQAPAKAIEQEFKRARRSELRAGIKTPQSRTGYFTHTIEDLMGAKGVGGRRGKTIRAAYTKSREHRGTIRQIAERGGPQFSENVPLAVADRLSRSAHDVAQAKLNRAVIQGGKVIKPGHGDVQVKAGQAVFEVKGKEIRSLDLSSEEDRKLLGRVASGHEVPKQRTYVVANEDFVKHRLAGVSPGEGRAAPLKALDKVTGGFKFTATVPNPGFHLRNLYGDSMNAYLGQPGHKLVRNTGTAVRVLKQQGKREEAARTVANRLDPTSKIHVKDHLGRKQAISIDELAREAEAAGAIRQGYIGRELPELFRSGESTVKKVSPTSARAKAGRSVKRTLQSREDLMRLATYIGGRRDGLTAREAAAKVAKHHFDYGDLSPFERNVMRRLLPFYTFSARNIPLQAKSFVQRPGKFANIEKAREEVAKAQGINLQDWESKDLREFQQRAVPFPLKIGGTTYSISTALPQQDLNELPVPGTKAFGPGAFEEWGKKFTAMLNPVVRTPAELFANYNSFFRSPIESDQSPLVAAPGFVSQFPPAVRKKLGIVPDYVDRRTGKKTWGWPAKVDYAAKVVPGPPNTLQALATNSESRRGQSQGGKLISALGGIKADRIDRPSVKIDRLFTEKKRLEKQRAKLRQRGIGSSERGRRETKEYRRIRDQLKQIDSAITRLSARRGDKHPLLDTGSGSDSGPDWRGRGGGKQGDWRFGG